MKPKKLSRFLSAVLALALVAGLMPAAFAAEGEEAPVVEIAEDNITLEVGRNVELTLTVSPNASVDWSSDDSDIATVCG